MSGRVNLLSPEVRANPFPFYTELRRQAPVVQVDPGGFWAVTRHDEALAVLKNPKVFMSEGLRRAWSPPWYPDYPLAESIIVMDPPRHTRLRALVNRAFGTAGLTRLEPRIRQLAEQAAAELPLGRPVNFVEAFTMRVPAGVIGHLLGLPESMFPRLKSLVDALTITGIAPNDLAGRQRAHEAEAELGRYFEQVVEARRDQPSEDMVGDLLQARVDGEALSARELRGFLFLLLMAGLETTVSLLSYCAIRLCEQPELMAQLRADPSLLPRFIDEMLRYETAVSGSIRMTTEEVELGGVRLPQGALVTLLWGSINRDERRFPDPDRFDLHREGTPHLAFGHGIHYCLGAGLAKLEARLALEALLARCSRLTRGEAPVQWKASMVMRAPEVLPLVAHPA